MEEPELTKHIRYLESEAYKRGFSSGDANGFARGVRIEVHSVLPEPENFEELRDKLVNAVREKLKVI